MNIIPLVQAKIKQVFLEITRIVIKSTADNSKLENCDLGTLQLVQFTVTMYISFFCVVFSEIEQSCDSDYNRHSPAQFTIHIKCRVEYWN